MTRFSILALLGVILLSLIACTNATLPDHLEITFPASGASFSVQTLVTLAAKTSNGSQPDWSSDRQGPLGKGATVTVRFDPGTHTIRCNAPGCIAQTVVINVYEESLTRGSWLTRLVTSSSTSLDLKASSVLPVAINLGGDSPSFVAVGQASRATLSSDQRVATHEDWRRLLEPRLTMAGTGTLRTSRSLSAAPTHRRFHVADTTANGVELNVEATLQKVGSRARIWLEDSVSVDSVVLDELSWTIDQRIVPRLTSLWGDLPDADADGTVAVLITKTINVGGVATGFFNPQDFFAYNANPESRLYNPVSNEMDILYLAVPVLSDATSPYSMESLRATVAHELTHMIQFGHHTLPYVTNQSTDPPLQEVFLDEAMAHLSESLCGYGISGGNIYFANQYLLEPENYSLGAAGNDSLGRRGGMALILSWLFWTLGGAQFTDEGNVIDKGGVSFLHRLVDGRGQGWSNVEDASGKTRLQILESFAREVAETSLGFRKPTVLASDPVTGEPLGLDPFMGAYTSLGNSIELTGPRTSDWSLNVPMAPGSLSFGKSSSGGTLSVTTNKPPSWLVMEFLVLASD